MTQKSSNDPTLKEVEDLNNFIAPSPPKKTRSVSPKRKSEVDRLLDLEAIRAEKAKRHLKDFIKEAWGIIEHKNPFVDNWHIGAICEALEAVINLEIKNLLINVPPRTLLADSTPILTTNGWKTHGTLAVGDYVFHPSGNPIRVVEVKPPHIADYEISFSNGEKIKCNAEHLWTIWNRTGKQPAFQTVSTSWFITKENRWGKTLNKPKKLLSGTKKPRCSYQLPCVEPLHFPKRDLPISPYTVGAWLGDGSRGKAALTFAPKDRIVADKIAEEFPISVEHVHSDTGVITASFSVGKGNGISPMLQKLRDLGIANNKHIPNIYLHSSIEQRLELLAGLIDTDGCVVKGEGRVKFANTNKRLIDGVTELVRSFGWRACITEIPASEREFPGGNVCKTAKSWVVSFSPSLEIPTLLKRKQGKFSPVKRRIGVVSVTKREPERGRCITVDSEDGLYLAGRQLIPTHNSKSSLSSIMLHPWAWIKYPELRWIYASYSAGLSTKHATQARHVMTSPWYRRHFGSSYDITSSAITDIRNSKTGYRITTSVEGMATGVGGNILVADDPHNVKEADSELKRKGVISWWDGTMSTRAEGDPKNLRKIIVMQRVHDNDLSGHVLEQGGYVHLCIPMEFNPKSRCVVPEINFKDPRTKQGELLDPNRYDQEWIDKKKGTNVSGKNPTLSRNMTSFAWSGQFQQDPVPLEGGMAKREWFSKVFYKDDPEEMRKSCYKIFSSWDMNFKAEEESSTEDGSYVVGTVWGQHGPNLYLIKMYRAKIGFNDTLKLFKKSVQDFPEMQEKLVEDRANGTAIIETLKKKIPGILSVDTNNDPKSVRYGSVLWLIESGNVRLPDPDLYPWVEDVLYEACRFPKAAYDDIVDSMTHALIRYHVNMIDPEALPTGVGTGNNFQHQWAAEDGIEREANSDWGVNRIN